MKVLVISHNPITTYNNMGKTLLSMFSSFSKEELCQLYVYPTIPDVDTCHAYFRLTDLDALRSYCPPFRMSSREISKEEICSENQELEKSDGKWGYHHASHGKRLLREWVWRGARWYNRSLSEWLHKEKPTCIFVAPGDAAFLYDIAMKISRRLQIPMVAYICDDYYFAASPRNWIGDMQHRLLRKKIEEIMNRSCLIVGISQEIIDRYSEYFSVETALIMTGSNVGIVKKLPKKKIIKNYKLKSYTIKALYDNIKVYFVMGEIK
jgi:hypothetical protein